MHFSEWVKSQSRGVLTRVARQANLSYGKVLSTAQGYRVAKYETAEKISKATNGEVTIDELCDLSLPIPPQPAKRKRAS